MINTAGIDINIFGSLKAEHKIAAPGHALIIEQIFYAHIISGDITATGAATKNKCGGQIVINTTQPANRCGAIDNNASGINGFGKFFNHRFIISKNAGCMPGATGIINIQRSIDAFFVRRRL